MAGAISPSDRMPVATWYSSGWNRWCWVRAIIVTSTGAFFSALVAVRPPKPEPMTTTRCRRPAPSALPGSVLMWAPIGQLGVGDTGEVALQRADRPVAGSVQGGHIDVASQVGDEHAVVAWIERDADAFHQVGRHDSGSASNAVQRGPVDGVAIRRVPAVGPVQRPCGVLDFEVDRLGQVLEHHLDVAAVRRGFACGKVDPGPQDPAEPRITRALLRPVEMPADMVDGDAHAPARLVVAVVVTLPVCTRVSMLEPSRSQRITRMPSRSAQYSLRSRFEVQLLGGVRASVGNDRGAVASVQVHASISRRSPAACPCRPVDVAGHDIDGVDPDNVERFLREQHAMGKLSGHPNIVNIIRSAPLGSGRPYIVMQYHPQDSLSGADPPVGPLGSDERCTSGSR